jgi:hypothetical protein
MDIGKIGFDLKEVISEDFLVAVIIEADVVRGISVISADGT